MRCGGPMGMLVAAAGVAGAAPPATVEIVYCCAKTTAWPASNRLAANTPRERARTLGLEYVINELALNGTMVTRQRAGRVNRGLRSFLATRMSPPVAF